MSNAMARQGPGAWPGRLLPLSSTVMMKLPASSSRFAACAGLGSMRIDASRKETSKDAQVRWVVLPRRSG